MIIITGASGGIGKNLLSGLKGLDNIIGIYNKNKFEVRDGDQVILEQIDLTSSKSISNFINRRADLLKDITVVHCAALKKDGLLASYVESDWENMINLNLKANFLFTKALLPRMLKDNWGRIVHLSSVAGAQGVVGASVYGATKTGLIGLSRGLAKEYAKFNITSNIIELGYFETGLFNDLSGSVRDTLLDQIPSKKLGEINNIINCIEFIIKSGYVNGATINIDGGL